MPKAKLLEMPTQKLIPSLEELKIASRISGKEVSIKDELVQHWLDLKTKCSKTQKQINEALAIVLDALGDAEKGTCSFGTVTYLPVERGGFSVEETSYRVPRFKKSKS